MFSVRGLDQGRVAAAFAALDAAADLAPVPGPAVDVGDIVDPECDAMGVAEVDCAALDEDSDDPDLDRMDDEESLLCTAASEVHKKWEREPDRPKAVLRPKGKGKGAGDMPPPSRRPRGKNAEKSAHGLALTQ